MKAIKVEHKFAQEIKDGSVTSTVRLYDDKNLSVNDQIEIIDRVDDGNRASWQSIGIAEIIEVTEKRIRDVADSDAEVHERYGSKEGLLLAMRQYYGQRVDSNTPIKIIKLHFKSHQSPQPVGQLPLLDKANLTTIRLFCDGGSRGNPGPSAAGFVLIDQQGNVIHKSGAYLGITTNNQAEYQALRLGLEEAKKLGIREVSVHMDSLLVVNQMKGVFKVKNRDLWPIHEAIKELAGEFKKVSYTHVPRELNKLADAEVNEILDVVANKSVV